MSELSRLLLRGIRLTIPSLIRQTTNTTNIFMPLGTNSLPPIENIVASDLFRQTRDKAKVVGIRRVLYRVFRPRPHRLHSIVES